MNWREIAHWTSICSLIALVFLCLTWETVLAPLRPSGSLLLLKAVPLLAPLFGILRGKRHTYQWAGLLALAYFTEGVVRAWADSGPSQQLAAAEIVLSVALFAACATYVRLAPQPGAAT
jgi:uncharacterized membrane protein